MSELHKSLFNFASAADRLNTELRTMPFPDKPTEDDMEFLTASGELRDYLSLIARRAENVASRLVVAADQKARASA